MPKLGAEPIRKAALINAAIESVARADSWSTDAHKWLNAGYDCGFVAVRDAAAHRAALSPIVERLNAAGIRVSLFIDPDERQVAAAAELGAPVVELHTGAYAEAGDKTGELRRLQVAAGATRERGIECHAGHGLTFDNVGAVAAVPEVVELNIGHYLIGEAIFTGLSASIQEMKRRIDAAISSGPQK